MNRGWESDPRDSRGKINLNGQERTVKERLELFDQATQRQKRRHSKAGNVFSPAARGWKREKLYARASLSAFVAHESHHGAIPSRSIVRLFFSYAGIRVREANGLPACGL